MESENPEKSDEQILKDSQEQRRAYKKQWRITNKERVLAYKKEWRQLNIAKISAYEKIYRDKNKERRRANKRVFILKSKYNLSPEEYDNLIITQNNCCKICGNEFTSDNPPNIDHCHTNLSIRGVLCRTCNMGLGMFKDNPEFLRKAIEYVNS